MGALSYEPDEGQEYQTMHGVPLDISRVGDEATSIYEGKLDDVIEHHTIHGSPSGGARPKILIGLSEEWESLAGADDLPDGYRHWLVKFPTGSSAEHRAEGVLEYLYFKMATQAGISMEPCALHRADGNSYFMTRRFDRLPGNRRVHVHTVAGLMHTNFRLPDFEYTELMRLTAMLTRSHVEKTELFRRMVFNVLAGNRDDHTKNFAFMLNDDNEWINTPAYDLTFNSGIAGQHSMTVNGRGADIELEDLMVVAETGSISPREAREVIAQVANAVSQWHTLTQDYDLPNGPVRDISAYTARQLKRIAPVA